MDIIPPILDLPNGQNWPDGQGILKNGCEVKPDPGPLPDAVFGEVDCADDAFPGERFRVTLMR